MNSYSFFPLNHQSTIFPLIDSKKVLKKAREWGFPCHEFQSASYLILPLSSAEKWQLQFDQDRWLLLLEDIPQVFLLSAQVIIFLNRHRQISIAV